MKKILLMLLSFCFCEMAYAQHTVTGKVSAGGESVPGVSVVVQGTTKGTTTDIEGKYSLDVNTGNETLVFSFIGYSTKEIAINGRTSIDVNLEEDITELQEVVVIGYGTVQKKLLTGATGQVKGDKIDQLSTTGTLDALQGQIAGVNIAATSGQPGDNLKVTIRGAGTIGGSNPLYIVDGIQTGDISYLNTADIASIDVLKDAASAAIYGAQAANGVVLITTKTGFAGKAKFSFDSYYGVQEPSKQISMLNAKEYAVIMNEAAINSGKVPHFTEEEIDAMGEGTDWIDEMMYNNAVMQNYVLGINGGSDRSIYSLSGTYTSQDGIVGGPGVSEYERYSIRLNSEHKFFDDILTFGQHLTGAYMKKNGISVGNQYNNTLRGAYNTSPFLPMYDDDGNFLNNTAGVGVMYNGEPWQPWFNGESNPYANMILNNQRNNNNQKVFGDFYAEVEPIKNLKFKTRFAYDYYVSESRSYLPEYELSIYSQRLFDQASQGMSKGIALTWDNTLTYDLKVNQHNLSFLLGTSAYSNKSNWINISNAGLIFSDLDHAFIDNTTNTDFTRLSFGGGPSDPYKLLSLFGRLTYDYAGKYLFNATLRRDGSSNFAEGNRIGYFPSVSAGWVLSEEDFWSGAPEFLGFMKLRGSWGQVGNANISAFQYLAPVSIGTSNYYFGIEDFNASGNAIGAYPSRLPNTEVKWETSEQINIGLDAMMFQGRLEANIDWYKKTTIDWLLQKPGYATDGADAPFFNGGKVENKGIELVLSWQDQIGDVNYFVTLTGSKNKNTVKEVPTEDGIIHGLTNMLYDNAGEFYHRAKTGYPIGYFWGWETNGIFQNEEQVASYRNSEGTQIQPNAKPGDLIYVDQDGNGVINDADKGMIGDPNPDYTYSLNFGFDYKGFDFSVMGYGVAGNQLVQSYRNHANAYSNYTTAILGRWHGEGTSNSTPRVTETNVNYQFSDIFVQDGDFFRINNMTLGYNFTSLLQTKFFTKVRLYATVQNAFVFTKYDGMDPEVGYGLENGSSGVDVGYYPRPRTYMLGLNVNF
ncbi:SusC/RagA family TonB-linked outer membrane protein [Fulvivirga ligni]|uniref:SusC/RagA family TonB-linked outer membrane protein n=1 Tax=Fulvivirga ligni TaxID=2904246 RepID=UPI001F181EF6|nr:TonB-dependent receptor [Fulvivirga ligni]UII23707.1 TonB-dependent receptor [Fulvivirga ligni]